MSRKANPYKEATAIVTGAASGIGKAIATELAARGCTVVLADRQLPAAEAIAIGICQSGGKAWAVELDVTCFSSFQCVVEKVVQSSGKIDYVFNNAGIGIGGPAEDYTIKDWNDTIDVNLRGVINGVQAVYPIMISQQFGHIVNTSSIAGLIPAPGSVAYTASKFAVAGLSQALRVEAETVGVRVSVLCPGAVKTPILTGGKYGRLPKGISPQVALDYWKRARPIEAAEFAQRALDLVAINKAMIIIPGQWALLYWVYRFSWRLWFWVSKRDYVAAKKLMAKGQQDALAEAALRAPPES